MDFSVLLAFKVYILSSIGGMELYIATALGFIAGLTVNYILSVLFVFRVEKKQNKRWYVISFAVDRHGSSKSD